MNDKPVLWEENGHIGYIQLNRPDELNTFNYETLVALGDLIEQIEQRIREIRVIVVTGKGRAFSAGADLKERLRLNPTQVRRNVKKIRDVFSALGSLPQPTIACINGYAFGGGFELALACDFRFAVKEARMGQTEVSLGIIPGAGGTQRLTRLIGPAKAKELILTARKISAEEAFRLGIIGGIAEDQAHLETLAGNLANEILVNAPLAVYQAKFAVDRGESLDLQSGLNVEAQCYEVLISTKDRVEALEAFREKRKPIFLGE